MKISKVITSTVCAVLALSFAGCKIPTATDFSVIAESRELVANDALPISTTITIGTTTWSQASKVTTNTITISSDSSLDEESIEAALNFFALKDNTNKYNYPVRDAQLTKTKTYIKSSKNGTKVDTVIDYMVDSSTVTTNYVAVFVDAAVLKDKQGKFVLNGDGNDKAGEESDSWIGYIEVTSKADGSAATQLNNRKNETFAPTIPTALSVDTSTANKLKFIVSGPTYYDTDGNLKADSELVDLYNQIFEFYTIAPDATEWSNTALTFAWDDTAKQYTSTVDLPVYGTDWKVVKTEKPDLCDTKSVEIYGHQAKVTFKNAESKSIANDGTNDTKGTVWNLTTSAETIINPDLTAFSAGVYPIADIETAQKTYLSATPSTNAPLYWDVACLISSSPFATHDGFVAFDKNGNKLETVVYEMDKDSNGDVTKIRVAIKNVNYYTAGCQLYVGKETSIKANTTNTNQKQFGCQELRSDTYHKGLIKLN